MTRGGMAIFLGRREQEPRLPSAPIAVVLFIVLSGAPFFAAAAMLGPTPASVTSAEFPMAPPSEPAIWEYVPPAPGVNIPADALAEHTLSYTPRKTPLATTPNAFNFKIGTHKALVVLAEFNDLAHRGAGSQAFYDGQMNANGSTSRSARTYFYENSYGNYTFDATVTTWVTLPRGQAYYGQGAGIYDLVGDAAKAADAQIDFTQFDEDGDGYVDNMIILHSGGDEAAGCGSQCIWAHSGAGYAVRVDGKWAQSYCTVSEFWTTGVNNADALGVLVHEFGHLSFDLPDLYDVYYNNDGTGNWDLMSAGSWAGGGTTPTHYSAWTKLDLGWIDPYVPTGNLDTYTIWATNDFQRANPIKIETNYTNEYFLVELRSESGGGLFDVSLPRDGLLIEHIDSNTIANSRYYNTVESTTSHKGVDIEEVGNQDMDSTGIGDAFPSNDVWVSNPTGFTPTSTPNTNLYQSGGSYKTGIKVYNISAVLSGVAPHITFSIDTGRVNYGLTGRVIGAPEQSAPPGGTATYNVQFNTLASSGDTVSLVLEGADSGSGSLNPTTLTLPPFGSASTSLTVNIGVGWDAGVSADVQVRATSITQPTATYAVATLTRTAQVYDIDALYTDTLSDTLVPATPGTKQITVRNLGNGEENVTLSASYDPAKVLVTIVNQPGQMLRSANTAVDINLTVQPTVLETTAIPVTLDFRYGPASAALHKYYSVTVTAGRLGRLGLEVLAVGQPYLDPGVARVFNLTVHNDGNYLADVSLTASAPAGVTVVFDVTSLQISAFSQTTLGVTLRPAADSPAWSTGIVYFFVSANDPFATAYATLNYTIKQRFELTFGGDSAYTAGPGSRVIFTLLAVNLGNGVDNTSLQVLPAYSEWNASLSATDLSLNATSSGRSSNVFLTVTVPPGAAGNFIQSFVVTILSQNAGVVSSHRVTVLVLPVYAFNVTIDSAQGPISNSETATFLVGFRNLGNVRDSYSVTVAGLPEGWRHEFAEGGVATIQPKFTGLMTLLITPAAGAGADNYDFQIYATSEGDLAQRKILLQRLTILAHHEIQIQATAVDGDVRPGAVVTVRLVIRNLGNVEERLVLEAPGTAFKSVAFDPFQVNVRPFEEAVATAIVVLRDDQASGYSPLVVTASSVSNASVSAEQTIGINVAHATISASAPGADAAAAGGAMAVAAAACVAASRRRRA